MHPVFKLSCGIFHYLLNCCFSLTPFFFVYLGFDYELTEVELEPSKAVRINSGDNMLRLEHKRRASLIGFKPASDSDYKLER